jgi:excisionase family DNA binding protein
MTIPPLPGAADPDTADDCTTVEVARRLGLAVRSVQLMVDRGELDAWKTPGGHRRISRVSVDRWLSARPVSGTRSRGERAAEAALTATPVATPVTTPVTKTATATATATAAAPAPRARPRVLLIEDSRHFQTLVGLLVKSRFPQVELHLADDGIAGLAMAGKLEPEVLLVDILLPGIDGATLITGLRTHPAFAHSRLIVITSLEGEALAPYAFALEGLPLVHKPRLAMELPALLATALAGTALA